MHPSLINILKSKLSLKINPSRIYGLDIIRALAVFFVVFGHSLHLFPSSLNFLHYLILDGVSIFFVLSGYLIGGIIIREFKNSLNRQNLLKFWMRRWFRTLPNYYFVLIIIISLNVFFVTDFKILRIHPFLYFSQNLNFPHPGFFPEAWSLSVEEWFYLIVPIFLLLFIKYFKLKFDYALIFVISIIIIISTLYRYYIFDTGEINNLTDWDNRIRKVVITRLDSIMYGIFGSYLAYKFPALIFRYRTHLLIVGILLIIFTRYYISRILEFNFFECIFYFTVESISFLLILFYFSYIKTGSGTWFKIITYTSLISYSLYLIHYTIVLTWILPFFKKYIIFQLHPFWEHLFLLILFYFLCIILSILNYKYFELPILRMRDKLFIRNIK